MKNIDDVMNDLEERDAERAAKERGTDQSAQGRVLIGSVDHFFDRISVAAIKLNGSLKVGDVIEIENAEYAIRQKVSSMQIDGKDVKEASDGDDVGVKLCVPAPARGSVYRIE
jgi:putative protease